MKSRNKAVAWLALGVMFAAAMAVGPFAHADTIKKLRASSPQLIVNETSVNDTEEAVSSTVDLSRGDLDKCSFAVYVTSSGGTSTLSYAVQISPDNGTSWVDTGDTITVSTGATAATDSSSAHVDNVAVSPGTKLRLNPTLGSSCTYYGLKVWALPSVD